jgi:hypothetical protein
MPSARQWEVEEVVGIGRLSVSFALVACLAVAALPLVPPVRVGGDFSTAGAMEHVAVIGQVPHAIGTDANEQVRSYLIDRLAGLGLSPQTQSVTVMDYFGSPGNTVDVVNVLARVEGTGDGDVVALVAHYDTTPETPGANDNSVSVAILLEVAAFLVADEPSRNDVLLLFTDGEEPNPRFGSRAFVDSHAWFDDVAFVVNLEAAGGAGPSILGETSGSSEWLIDLVRRVGHPVAFSFFTETASLIGGFGTDFDPFRLAGVPGVSFAYLHGSPIYHTDQDSIEHVGLRSVQHQGANTLALVRELADADLRPPTGSAESVFFSTPGGVVVAYPTTWALPTALVALVALVVAFGRRPRPRGAVRGLGLAVGAFLGATLLGALAWMAISGIRASPAIWESYAYLTVLLVGTGWLWRLVARRLPSDASFFGVVCVWLVLALVTSAVAPGLSHVFTWPALAGAAVALGRPSSVALRTLATGIVTLIVTVPIIDILFQLSQPRPGNPDSELIPVAGVVTGLALLVMALIDSTWRGPNRTTARERPERAG